MPTFLAADIHCHLLPGWDDGPRTREDSLELARALSQSGVASIVVTPHVDREEVCLPGRGASQIPAAVAQLQEELRHEKIEMRLVPGAEVMLSPGLPSRLQDEPWLCVGGPEAAGEGATRHILVEMGPGAPWTPEVDALLFQIALQGVTPILAHPERYPDIQRDLGIARGLAGRGVLLQVSAPSLLSTRGATGSTAHSLLREGLAAFVASDAHAARSLALEQACAQAEALLGEEGARQVLVENPRRLLSGQHITLPPRAPAGSKRAPSLLSRLLRRA